MSDAAAANGSVLTVGVLLSQFLDDRVQQRGVGPGLLLQDRRAAAGGAGDGVGGSEQRESGHCTARSATRQNTCASQQCRCCVDGRTRGVTHNGSISRPRPPRSGTAATGVPGPRLGAGHGLGVGGVQDRDGLKLSILTVLSRDTSSLGEKLECTATVGYIGSTWQGGRWRGRWLAAHTVSPRARQTASTRHR